MKYTNFMIDVETYGKDPKNDAMSSIGIVEFALDEIGVFHKTLHIGLDLPMQIKLGRTMDEDTMKWRADNKVGAMELKLEKIDNIHVVGELIAEALKVSILKSKKVYPIVWANHILFDISFLQNMYDSMGANITKNIDDRYPWKYNHIVDMPSYVGDKFDRKQAREIAKEHSLYEHTHHDAVSDCVNYILCVQAGFQLRHRR